MTLKYAPGAPKAMFKRSIFKILVKDFGSIPLVSAQGDQRFWVHEGPVLCDLRDLWRSFSTMTDSQFAHHVTKEKNDFSAWVREVLRDKECARRIAGAKNQDEARRIVEARLKEAYSI